MWIPVIEKAGDLAPPYDIEVLDVGYIEEALYYLLSNNLEVEYVYNGDFTLQSGWTLGDGWGWVVIGENTEVYWQEEEGDGDLEQALCIVPSRTYTTTYTVAGSNFRPGMGVTIQLGNASGTMRTADGSYTEDIVPTTYANLKFVPTGSGRDDKTCRIDDVSVIDTGINSRIFPAIAPHGDSLPFITYQQISGVRQQVTTHSIGMVQARFQINCWGETYGDCNTVAMAVRKLLDGYAGTVEKVKIHDIQLDNEIDLQELVEGVSQSERRGKALDFIVWYREQT
jgi:hypothetical protein